MAFLNPTDEHGWTAWDFARAILGELQRMNEETGEDSDPPVTRLRRTFVIPTDGAGNGQVELLLPAGYAWNLLTYAIQTAPAATQGYLAFYRDEEQGTGLIKVVPGTQLADDMFNADGHFIPEQSKLVIVVRGMNANTVISGNLTAKGISNITPRATVMDATN